jgi:RNA polymerase sigma-70 factor (ECF subfamily)
VEKSLVLTTSSALLERLRQPAAHDAWTRFVRLYTPLLYHWAGRLGLQPQDAADLVQDVLTTLVQKLPEFEYDRRQSFRAWLRTILLNRWRAGHRRPRAVSGAERVSEPAAPDDLDDLAEQEYRTYLVGRALRLLQSDFQPATWKAFWEFVVSGKSAAEVAGALGMRVDAVYVAKSRVLRRLRQELAGLLD